MSEPQEPLLKILELILADTSAPHAFQSAEQVPQHEAKGVGGHHDADDAAATAAATVLLQLLHERPQVAGHEHVTGFVFGLLAPLGDGFCSPGEVLPLCIDPLRDDATPRAQSFRPPDSFLRLPRGLEWPMDLAKVSQ